MTENAHPPQDRPLVTFALFAYNQEKYIREAVEGAFAQTYEPLEIILSDDCSSDRTFEIMQEMAAEYEGPHEVMVRQNSVNLGLAGHLNSIIFSAKGELICWAAGDDISIPDRTLILIEPMLENPNIVGTHSAVKRMDINGRVGERWSQPHMSEVFTKESVVRFCLPVSSQSHAFRAKAFKHFGPLRVDLTNEGAPMAFRELEFGDIKFIDTPTVYYRIGSGVSTYSGGDLETTKILEPIKIAQWRLSAYLQMRDDFDKTATKDPVVARNIELNIEFYSALIAINKNESPLRSLIRGLKLKTNMAVLIRAYLRVMAPKYAYGFFKNSVKG